MTSLDCLLLPCPSCNVTPNFLTLLLDTFAWNRTERVSAYEKDSLMGLI